MQQQPQQPEQINAEELQEPCRFFAAGNCRFGTSCRYLHDDAFGAPATPLHQGPPPPSSSVACRFFAQGNCKFGSKCRYHHSQQAMNRHQNRLNTPAPAPGSPCRYFSQGRCKYGQECRFTHDVHAQAFPPLPQQGYDPYGMVDPAVVAQVEAELAMEAELDAAIEATIDAKIRAEYEKASLEEEARIAHEEMLRLDAEQDAQDAAHAAEVPPEKSG